MEQFWLFFLSCGWPMYILFALVLFFALRKLTPVVITVLVWILICRAKRRYEKERIREIEEETKRIKDDSNKKTVGDYFPNNTAPKEG